MSREYAIIRTDRIGPYILNAVIGRGEADCPSEALDAAIEMTGDQNAMVEWPRERSYFMHQLHAAHTS